MYAHIPDRREIAKVQSVRCRTDPEVSTAIAASSEAVEDAADSARGVTMQLDIRCWHGRWFWRLAIEARVRFFGPTDHARPV